MAQDRMKLQVMKEQNQLLRFLMDLQQMDIQRKRLMIPSCYQLSEMRNLSFVAFYDFTAAGNVYVTRFEVKTFTAFTLALYRQTMESFHSSAVFTYANCIDPSNNAMRSKFPVPVLQSGICSVHLDYLTRKSKKIRLNFIHPFEFVGPCSN